MISNLIKPFKEFAIRLFIKLLKHDRIKPIVSELAPKPVKIPDSIKNTESPYYPIAATPKPTRLRDDIVFITSRFRSGSTALWNTFRSLESCTAYYEPFNERQWFNPATRGNHTDNTHLGVNDYWAEYIGLEKAGDYYRETWINENLLMDENSWDPNMLSYIDFLIESTDKTPVLQFNRVDFRLQWLKHHYPNAKIIHLYRNPRDQWCSFLTDKQLMNKEDVLHTYKDAFYLNSWCQDLKTHFPFLCKNDTPHPYQRFYYLWKLSYIYGKNFSDISIAYEDLNKNPNDVLNGVFDLLELNKAGIKKSAQVINKTPIDKWKNYASEDWFIAHEKHCEINLDNFLKQ